MLCNVNEHYSQPTWNGSLNSCLTYVSSGSFICISFLTISSSSSSSSSSSLTGNHHYGVQSLNFQGRSVRVLIPQNHWIAVWLSEQELNQFQCKTVWVMQLIVVFDLGVCFRAWLVTACCFCSSAACLHKGTVSNLKACNTCSQAPQEHLLGCWYAVKIWGESKASFVLFCFVFCFFLSLYLCLCAFCF